MTTTVVLSFPNIGKNFSYNYTYEHDRNREEEAFRTFYEQEAERLFALYGYASMDVSIQRDDREIACYHACYQETLWHSFFREGGEPWFGRFSRFTLSLIELRWREDGRLKERKAA